MESRRAQLLNCPECDSDLTYEDGSLFICPTCVHEWTKEMKEDKQQTTTNEKGYRDANGNILTNGDDVVVIKDLEIIKVHHQLENKE